MYDNLRLSWWDYKKLLMVSYTTSDDSSSDLPGENSPLLPKTNKPSKAKEVITGMAEWERAIPGVYSYHPLLFGRFDPRRLIKPLLSAYLTVKRKIFGNRAAAKPTPSNPDPLVLWNFLPRIIPCTIPFFSAPHRQKHWSLEVLGIDPAHQFKGYGKELVLDGLERAKRDPLGDMPACVVAADGKETFYQKVGFPELVGWASRGKGEDGSENPMAALGVGGGAVLWTR
jgi:GNAT superfamily N-acetyltransferase